MTMNTKQGGGDATNKNHGSDQAAASTVGGAGTGPWEPLAGGGDGGQGAFADIASAFKKAGHTDNTPTGGSYTPLP
jgi:hypothetical protein